MVSHGVYLLDTDICIALLKKDTNVADRFRKAGAHNCKISNISLAELYFGAYKSGKRNHFIDISEIMNLMEQYPINSLRKYGEIRWFLESKGLKIGDMDTFIAATALEKNLILVTGNTKHFNRVPGLLFENWMKQ
ncbi:MAG: PIN domain-containing protein [Bacteroidales bacterium]|nr:PIN domain-containing protein [Bacteroidales bacterium]